MKKVLISLLFLVPFVAGCTNVETQVSLNKDKSASVVSSVTYQGNLANKNDEIAKVITENYTKLLDKYYKIDTAASPKLSTITASKMVKNVEHEDLDLGSLGFKSNLPSGKFIETKKNFLVKSYNIDMTFDYNVVKKNFELPVQKSVEKSQSGINPEYYHKYIEAKDVNARVDEESNAEYDMAANLDESAKQLMEDEKTNKIDKTSKQKKEVLSNTFSFSIKVPTVASYNNADENKGTTYYWNIKKDAQTVIKLQYVQYSTWAFVFIVLLGILILIFIARKIIKRDSTKRIDNIENIV